MVDGNNCNICNSGIFHLIETVWEHGVYLHLRFAVGIYRQLLCACVWSKVINADKMGALPELTQVKLSKVNLRSGAAVDVSGFAKAPKLSLMTIYDCTVSGLESFANPKLRRVYLKNVKGITSLEGLKSCPELYQIEIANCPDIPDSALQGFSDKVKIVKR